MGGLAEGGAGPARGRFAVAALGCVAAGCLHGLSFSPVFFAGAWAVPYAWIVQLGALAAFVVCLYQAISWRAAGVMGWLFTTAWLSTANGWLFVSMHDYGHLSAALSALAVLALSAFLAVDMALAMAWFHAWRRGRWLADAGLFAACCLIAELARGLLFTGFPWAAMGYAHLDAPLSTLAPWVGVYGMGAAAAGLAHGLGYRLLPRRAAGPGQVASRRGLNLALGGAALGLALLGWMGPSPWTRASGELRVGLLQTDVPQDEKFAAEHLEENLAWATTAMLTSSDDLVMGPETVIALLPQDLPASFWDPWKTAFHRPGHAALVGIPLGSDAQGYTNSVLGLSPGWSEDHAYRYDKHHLVPFGEFVPLGFHWFVRMLGIPLGDFARGQLNPPSFVIGRERVAPNICYEDLFGEELAARFRDPAQAPTVLANFSNLAWFGRSMAIEQHLAISRMRSLELQRPMIRSTNTGATVVIDHHAVVTAALPPYTRGVLHARVQGRVGVTPYAWWASRWGLWPLIMAGLAAMAAPLMGAVPRNT